MYLLLKIFEVSKDIGVHVFRSRMRAFSMTSPETHPCHLLMEIQKMLSKITIQECVSIIRMYEVGLF